MNALRLTLLAGALALAIPATAIAQDPCAHQGFGLGTGPTRAGLIPGDLGAGWRACGRNEVGLGFGGALTVDRPAFYGHLAAQVILDGSWTPVERLELFAELEMVRVEMLITPLASSAIGLGHLSLGASYGVLRTKAFALAGHGRIVLPTAVPLYRNAAPFSFDLGVAGQIEINRHIGLHGDLTALFQAMAGKGPAAPRGGGAIVLGAEFVLIPEVAVVLDLKGRLGWGDEPLDMIAGAIGLRFSDCKRFGFEIDATLPIAGRDRTAVAVELRASVRWGPIARPLWGDVEHKRMMKAGERG